MQTYSKMHPMAPETTGRTIRWARYYDLVTGMLLLGQESALRKMTVEMAGVRPGETVLDVGCGTGSLTRAAKNLTGKDGEVHGVDAAPEMIEVASRKAAQAGLDIDFQIGLIERLPFPDDNFDLVLSSLMLHHLPDDLKRRGFAEILRVLKPGGRLFAVDFEPPKNPLLLHFSMHLLRHGMMQTNVRDYVPLMENAGYSNVQTERIRHALLSYVSGSKAG